jgi:hypothetical protein
MNQQNNQDPYIRQAEIFDDKRFIIHCQSKEQSRLLICATELHANKTFSRTKCQEWEINSYDLISKRIFTIARVYFDYEDQWAYQHTFTAVFDRAEKDMGYRVPFGCLIKSDADSLSGSRIKAILLDEHAGQIRGLDAYFQSKFPNDNKRYHIIQIVKTCKVHFDRSLQKLSRKGSTPEYRGKFN